MKLVIQIPCWNEEKTIADVIASLPRSIEGVDTIEVVVIDDGSSDGTAAAAREAGATDVIVLTRHRGLAAAFLNGVETALRRNADILVNTDADLQYPSECIADLVKPIVARDADISIGDRLTLGRNHFSFIKIFLQRIGSLGIRILSGVPVHDAASGFRAFNRDAMESMFIHGRFSYTLESLILAGRTGMRLVNVPIPTNPPKRRSRLFRSIPVYLAQSTTAVVRAYLMYHPLRFFVGIGAIFLLAAVALGVRFLYFYLLNSGAGHTQSLILAAIFSLMGFQCVVLGLIGDLLAANRRLLEKLRIHHLRGDLPDTHAERKT